MKVHDFKQEFGELYFPPAKAPTMVRVPSMNFAAVDGQGAPERGGDFQRAISNLYGVSYTARFAIKKAGVGVYRVPPLEALWSTDRRGGFTPTVSRGAWRWTVMIMQPPPVTPSRFRDAIASLRDRRDSPGLSDVRFERFAEGRSVQMLHVGPYSSEGPTIERIHSFIREHGWKPEGRHHEIYLGDPRTSSPRRLRTVLRQPYVR